MIGAIVQARMGSTRLPEKVMRKVLDRPLLYYLLERLNRSKMIDRIVIATTVNPNDQIIADFAKEQGVAVYRGSENDVLDRYYQAAKEYGLDTIVRITADCPMHDPQILDGVIRQYANDPESDFIATGPSYPEGFDVEVFSFKTLSRAWQEASLVSEREHVTPYIKKSTDRFKVKILSIEPNLSHLRLTVDEKVDFRVIKGLIERLYSPNKLFGLKDLLRLYETEPEMFQLNQHVIRNEGYFNSLLKDKEVIKK
ncbi:cytidylyltransferase domain-containing protein [Candidatus Margulisiibacteriota bacterium]